MFIIVEIVYVLLKNFEYFKWFQICMKFQDEYNTTKHDNCGWVYPFVYHTYWAVESVLIFTILFYTWDFSTAPRLKAGADGNSVEEIETITDVESKEDEKRRQMKSKGNRKAWEVVKTREK